MATLALVVVCEVGHANPAVGNDASRLELNAAANLGRAAVGGGAAPSERYLEINFSITVTNLVVARKFQFDSTFSGDCVVGPRAWRLEGGFFANGRTTFYCDGTNVLETTTGSEPPAIPSVITNRYDLYPNSKLEGPRAAVPIRLSVTPGLHPLPTPPSAGYAWLAYCSGLYLAQPGRLVPFPGSSAGHDPFAYSFRDQTTTFSDELGLPRKMEFHADPDLLARATNQARLFRPPAGGPRRRARPGDVSRNTFSYQVELSTNVAGWNVPLRFTAAAFFYGNAAPEPSLITRIEGRTLSVVERHAAPDPLLIKGRTFIVDDHRPDPPARMVDNISYSVTNGVLPSVDDPRRHGASSTDD